MTAHPLVAEATALGIRIEAEGGALRVWPASRLPPELRARIAAAKPELLEALAANDDGVDWDPARWSRFKALCLARGVTPTELAEHFPSVADREDIALSADDGLEALAGHVAGIAVAPEAVRATDALWRAIDGVVDDPDAPDAWRTRPVSCGACVSFVRTSGHAHAGRCAANAPERTSAVLWDTDRRTCGRFEVAA